MRLITKTTLLFLLLALAVFGIGGIITYNNVWKEVQQETDYALASQLRLTVKSLREGTAPEVLINKKVKIVPAKPAAEKRTKPVFSDTLAMHMQLKRMEQQRKATVVREVHGTWYQISITDVFIELEDVYEGVFFTHASHVSFPGSNLITI